MNINSIVLNKLIKFSIKTIKNSQFYRKLHYTSCSCNNLKNSIQEEKECSIPQDTVQEKFKKKLLNGPNLKDFFKNEHLKSQEGLSEENVIPYLQEANTSNVKRKICFEVYGCQMNVSDTEIIWSILKEHNFTKTTDLLEADVVLFVTCAIREGAENKIWQRLNYVRSLQKIRRNRPSFKVGILGCMAERLKEKVLEKDKTVDVVAGPDAYRDLPRLLALTENNQKSVNVLLSLEETYADITPVRLNENSVSAFVSIMRGCDNMCTYCIVPFTRGRERSRPVDSILKEVEQFAEQGVREITLLGQNVNSYRDLSRASTALVPYSTTATNMSKGFKTVYKTKLGGLRFADLLCKVAEVHPEVRIRFTSPHPKDFPDEVLHAINNYPNICKSLHMPVQSGNSTVLERMRRGYSREAYLELISHIRSILPNVSLSSDFICGFCGETDEEFQDTLTLMDIVKYNVAYLFQYSMREKTTAHRRFKDDVPPKIKQQRLEQMVKMYRYHAEKLNYAQIGQVQLVLVEGSSKRSKQQLAGRNDGNMKVIMPLEAVCKHDGTDSRELKPGDYVAVQINASNSQVLKGIPLYRTTLQEFYANYNSNRCSMNEANFSYELENFHIPQLSVL